MPASCFVVSAFLLKAEHLFVADSICQSSTTSNMSLILLIALLFAAHSVASQSNTTTGDILIYTEANTTGQMHTISLNPGHTCHVIDEQLKGKVVSLNTNNNCVEFFMEPNCTGISRHVFPGTDFPHTDLRNVSLISGLNNVADAARSIRRCLFQDREGNEDPVRRDSFEIHTKNASQSEAQVLIMSLNPDHSCTGLQNPISRVVGVNTRGYCIQFFADDDCDPSGGSRHVFPGVVFPEQDFRYLSLTGRASGAEDTAKSYRRCIFS